MTAAMDDTADERLVWALLAVGGSVGALLRAALAEQPGTEPDRVLAAIASAASRQAIETAREGS